ncbi:MAG: riboflavin synthase subunit alpha [Spongiibacteraceae bacterium]
MYTGIVHGAFSVVALEKLPGLSRLALALPPVLREDLQIGASVGLDGVCMTVTNIEGDRVFFDAMAETLNTTGLGGVQLGSRLNVERSARQGAEVGGHNISGHVDGTAEICGDEHSENNRRLSFCLPVALKKYVFHKGFIAVNGCSLTVASYDPSQGVFSVCLIPETLRVTNFAEKTLGDNVNIEVDKQTQVIVDTVERVLAERE